MATDVLSEDGKVSHLLTAVFHHLQYQKDGYR